MPLLAQEDITFTVRSPFEEQYGTPVHEDNDGKKHYLIGLSGAALSEFVIYAWDRWIIDAGWAQTTWEFFLHPENRTPEFDTDWVWTNFVLHPFQGSLYYMAARNANLNRIESLIITALGDFTWEWFCETTNPSISDLVYSFFGAFAVGEMMYRLSLEAEAKCSVLGYIINPMRIWSDPWMRKKPRGTVGNLHDFSLKVFMGTTHSYTNSAWEAARTGVERFPLNIVAEANVVYNDPYGHDSNVPFSQFELRFGAGTGPSSGTGRGQSKVEEYIMYNIFINSNGMLLARAPDWGKNRDTTIGFVFDYDFRWHSLVDLASLAPGVAIKQRITYEKSRIEWQAHQCWNILGITDNYYIHRDPRKNLLEKERDYDYITGTETVLALNWLSDRGILFENIVHFYVAYDFAAQAHDGLGTGVEFFGFYNCNVEFPVAENIRVGIGNELYLKKALYTTEQNVFQIMYAGGVYAKILLK